MKLELVPLFCHASKFVVGIIVTGAQCLRADTVWTGPTIGFYHTPENNLADQLTPGVAITRAGAGGLYNSVTEGGATAGTSPDDTEWATGALSNYATLTYSACPLESGNHPPGFVGTTFVVHLITENIYLSLTLTNWGGAMGVGDNTFGYSRSTPVVVTAPTPSVTITNPPAGSIFTVPANVLLGANATVSSGAVTNVQFFTNGARIGSVQTAPFNFTASNLAAGSYALKAVATAAGISATSAVVNISVVAPTPSVTITNPPDGSVFAAPATVSIAADATVSNGTVTNVQFFTNGVLLGAIQSAPFSLLANNLAAGGYALTAVARASGISATSAVVSVTVVNPVPINISGTQTSNGLFFFNYDASSGISYTVQSSTDLVNWVSLVTNVALGSPVAFSNSINPFGANFYRVSQLPNP